VMHQQGCVCRRLLQRIQQRAVQCAFLSHHSTNPPI
jgi:hypothetical protein